MAATTKIAVVLKRDARVGFGGYKIESIRGNSLVIQAKGFKERRVGDVIKVEEADAIAYSARYDVTSKA